MFLNSSPQEFTPRAIYGPDRASLTDNDVNYYGFLQSKEYQEVYENVLMQPVQTMEAYVSPYFGQGNGAYRDLDRAYEAYKVRINAVDVYIDPKESEGFNPDDYYKRRETSSISPALILAAAAAFFFAG